MSQFRRGGSDDSPLLKGDEAGMWEVLRTLRNKAPVDLAQVIHISAVQAQ